MSVRQEKNIKKLPKDGRSWYYDAYYNDIYGNRKEKKSKYYKTKTEARDAELEFLNGLKKNNTFNTNISGKQLVEEWLEFKSNKVKPSTYYGIEKFVNKHMKDFFIAFKNIHHIKITNLLQWRQSLSNKTYSINHKNKLIGYFKEILQYAIDNYEFDKKVFSKLIPFREDHKAQKLNEAEWNYITPEEWKQFIAVVDNDFDITVYNFLYYTGVRIGECAGLIWKNVDLENARIKIVQQATYKVKNKGYTVIDPKTSNSVRNVDLPNKLVELLKKHYEHEKKIYGFNSEWFVFGNIRPLAQTTLRRHLNNYIELSGVKKITIHGFRHSHVSLLIDLGCDVRDVANRIGDTVQTVEKVYYHMFPKKKQKTVELLNNI